MQDIGRDTGWDTSRDHADDVSDGRWLTYQELAKLRGIDRASAFKLALRHKWRRQKNNQGQVTVFVPSDFIDQPDASSDTGHDTSRQATAFETALAVIREAHAGEIMALREQLNAAKAEWDVSRDRAERAETALGAERDRADRAEEDRRAAEGRAEKAEAEIVSERHRADAASALADRLVAQLAETTARSDAEITTLHDAVGGMRGTLARTEDRAARAEERAMRADALIANLEADLRAKDSETAGQRVAADQAHAEAQEATQAAEALRGQLTGTQAELAQQRILTDQARQYASEQEQEAQQALQAAHELRRTDDARKARGRWARLRAAWRGE